MTRWLRNLRTGHIVDVPDGHWALQSPDFEMIEPHTSTAAWESFTLAELREYATENGIALGTATRKADVVALIEAATSE